MGSKYKVGDTVWYQYIMWSAPAVNFCSGVVESITDCFGKDCYMYHLKGQGVGYYENLLYPSERACMEAAKTWMVQHINAWGQVCNGVIQKLKEAPYGDFCDDAEKMKDFRIMSKDAFLSFYSYLTEEEYDLTKKKVDELRSQELKALRGENA